MESKENFYPLFGGSSRCRRGSCGCGCTDNGDRDTRGDSACTEGIGTSGNDPLKGASLAMVYSPEQAFEGLYEPDEALVRGTVFIALEKPFYGDGRKC